MLALLSILLVLMKPSFVYFLQIDALIRALLEMKVFVSVQYNDVSMQAKWQGLSRVFSGDLDHGVEEPTLRVPGNGPLEGQWRKLV